ncbi:uncharacterized protein LOC118240542 [Electrophorus electricus]|uniref:uncharacterized protein LOC118240542 n=1 Tax=Electrophorus electricus TaxID=8005 RepID=UPI0015D0599A|nr:uncharacterized protein LOC118240542 [Electrophorus electricus]
MPGKGSKRRRGKKGSKRPSTTLAETLASLHTPMTGGKATGGFWRGPGYGSGSDSAELYRPQPDYGEQYFEDQYSEVDSAGSYDPYMDCYEGYADYGGRGECSNVSLQSDLGFDYVEDPSMEVEVLNVTDSDVESAVSRSDEPPAPKILLKSLPRKCCSGTSKPFNEAHIEATSFEEEISSTRAPSPGTCGPVPKPRPRRIKPEFFRFCRLTRRTGRVC